jgi:hypothetical protein
MKIDQHTYIGRRPVNVGTYRSNNTYLCRRPKIEGPNSVGTFRNNDTRPSIEGLHTCIEGLSE